MDFWGLNSHIPSLWAQSPVIIGGELSQLLMVGRYLLFYFLILFSQNENDRTPEVNRGTLHLGATWRFLAPPTPRTLSPHPWDGETQAFLTDGDGTHSASFCSSRSRSVSCSSEY